MAHSSPNGATVTRINFFDQAGPWGPVYIDPAGSPGFGKRKFLITAPWNVQDGHLSGNLAAADVALPDVNRYEWFVQQSQPITLCDQYGSPGQQSVALSSGQKQTSDPRFMGSPVPTWLPDQFFISYPDTNVLDVLEVATGSVTTVSGLLQPVNKLTSYFKH